jgi:hypothetical protein
MPLSGPVNGHHGTSLINRSPSAMAEKDRQGLTARFPAKELGWIERHCTDIPPKSPVSYCCTTLSTCTKTTACRIAIPSVRVICDLPFSFRQTVL